MKITKLFKIEFDELCTHSFDLIIVASGYESRSRAIGQDLKKCQFSPGIKKWAWGFEEYSDFPTRLKNNRLLEELGFKIELLSSNDLETPEKLISEFIHECGRNNPNILVDISSMSRTWYGGIIKAISRIESPSKFKTVFAYTPAKWLERRDSAPPNEVVGPVSGYASHALPNKPTALLIGLGKDYDRALGLNDYLDPKITICFYPSPGADFKYEPAVLETNADLLNSIDPINQYTYNLYDSFGTYKKLESVCQGLTREYRVVLASLGPKLFGLYCFLIQINLPDISVWRVSPASRQKPVDLKAGKKRISLAVEWG